MTNGQKEYLHIAEDVLLPHHSRFPEEVIFKSTVINLITNKVTSNENPRMDEQNKLLIQDLAVKEKKNQNKSKNAAPSFCDFYRLQRNNI